MLKNMDFCHISLHAYLIKQNLAMPLREHIILKTSRQKHRNIQLIYRLVKEISNLFSVP